MKYHTSDQIRSAFVRQRISDQHLFLGLSIISERSRDFLFSDESNVFLKSEDYCDVS